MVAPLIAFGLAMAGINGISWLANNVLGTNDWLSDTFDPKISVSPLNVDNNKIFNYFYGDYMFKYQIYAPSNEDLKALDDFFTAYGYRVDRFQVPNLKVRDDFTFIKTRDCVVYSPISQASQQMQQMLNSGYRFWVGEIGE